MASHKKRRNEWTRSSKGGWTLSLGFRGTRVRLFQNRRDGTFYRAVWVPEHGRDVTSLRTKDRGEAERLGLALLNELSHGGLTKRSDKITLTELWERYRREAQSFLGCVETTKKDAESRVDILLGYFGEDCVVNDLTQDDILGYVTARLAGGITRRSGRRTKPVRKRSPEADLVLLKTMLRWATMVRVKGERWLRDNPLHGIRLVREESPLRPIATWERYEATRKAMQELAVKSESDKERTRWVKMELALVLAEATGRRLGSIRQLRWEDFDFEARTVRWRAEADKKRRESVVPLPAALADEIKDFQRRLGAIGSWVFARASDRAEPIDRHLFDKWLVVAEKHAGLPKLIGGLWHPYRRKWATERKNHSLKDVAAAAGWKDIDTLIRSYQQPTNDALLAVMSESGKVRDRAVSR